MLLFFVVKKFSFTGQGRKVNLLEECFHVVICIEGVVKNENCFT